MRTKRRRFWVPDFSRPRLELLEDRTLLDGGLVNAAITQAQANGILGGLHGLVTFANSLDAYGLLNQNLPGIRLLQNAPDAVTVGRAVDIAGGLQRGLVDPVSAFFQEHDGSAHHLPSANELVKVIKDELSGNYNGLMITVDPRLVTGGLNSQANQLQFTLSFQAARSLNVPIDLGTDAFQQYGLTLNASANVNLALSLNFSFTFGFKLDSSLPPAQAFFIQVNTFTACASAHVNNLNFGATFGFFDLGVQNASVNFDACVGVTFPGRTTVTLQDLGNPLSGLVNLAPTGGTSLNIALPVTGSLGGFTVPANATVSLATPNLFTTAPTITLPNFGVLLDFNNITAANVLGLFNQLHDWLVKLGDSSPLSLPLPFAQDWTVGDLFDFGQLFADDISSGLQSAPGKPAFATAQALGNLLARLLNLDPSVISANFDAAGQDLSYHVQLTESLPTESVPVAYNVAFGQGLASASVSGMVNFHAMVTLQFTVGINLTPQGMGQSLADKLYVQGASASGTLTMDASNISAMAQFGFLQIQSSGGSANATGNLTVNLKDPGSGTPGGRVTLKQLFDGLAGDPTTVVGVSVTGNASLSLQHISPTDNIFGTITGNPTITVTVPDLTNLTNPTFAFTDFDKFLNFRTVNFSSVVTTVTNVATYLQNLSGTSFLSTKLPLLDRSITDLLGYAGQFASFVDQFQANPTATVEGLAPELRMLLGLPPDDPSVNITYNTADNSLSLTFTFAAPHYMATLPLDFDFKQFVPNSPLDNLVSAAGSLSVQADASLVLHVGVDLSNPLTPVPFLYDDTGLTLSARATGSNLSLDAAIGPLGLFVRGGSAMLGPATFTVGLQQRPNHHWNFTDLTTSSANISLTGTATATLPLFFPTPNDPLGGNGNNNLTLNITNLGDIAHTTTVMTPDFSTAFSQVSLSAQLRIIIEGLDKLLETLQIGLNSQVFANLPLIGNNLQNTGHFVQDFRSVVISNLQQLANTTGDGIRMALFNTLGPGTGGLNILKKLDGSNGTPTIDDVQLDTSQLPSAVRFNIHLGQTYTVGGSTAFDIGLPGLGLTVNNAGVQVQLGWDFYLGFGVTRSSGFYYDTSRRNPLSVSLTATIPGLSAMGQLLLLNVGLQDNPMNPSMFVGQFAVDIRDPRNSGQLTFGDITAPGFRVSQIISGVLSGNADVHLKLRVDFGSANFPSLQTDFDMHWGFMASPTGVSLATFGMRPTFSFSNVSLDLGSFFSRFVSPILSQIQGAIAPISDSAHGYDVIGLLDRDLPVLSDLTPGGHVSFLSLLSRTNPNLALFLQAVRDVVRLINSIPTNVGTILINFGSFDLSNLPDIRTLGRGGLLGRTPNITAGMPGSLDQQLQNIGTTQAMQSRMFMSRLGTEPGGGISFPFFTNPGQLFGVLLGQNVTLFTWDLPTLTAGLSYSQYFPIPGIQFLGVRISGSITISAHLKFGFDTYGFTRYAQTHNLLDVFEGFYIDPTASYIRVQGRLAAAGELNVVVASAGVEGGITATVNVGLRDPEGMGKVRPHVLIAEAMQSPLCIFTVSGEVTASLSAYVSVGVWCPDFLCYRPNPYTLATVTLVSFNVTFCGPVATDFQVTTAGTTTAGAPTQVTVRAVDGSGAVVRNYRGTVHFTSSDPQGVLPRDYTFVAGDQGVHVFTLNLRTAGSQTITVTDTGNTGLAHNGALTVTPAAVSTFGFTVPAAPFTAGIAGSVTVKATDPYGNVVSGYLGTVHFTSTDMQAVLPADYQYVAADNGIHTFAVNFKTAPSQALTATDTAQAAITGTRSGIQVNPAAADHLVIRRAFPSPTTAGHKRMFELVAKDPFNNDATGYTGTVHFTGNPAHKDVLPADYTFAADDHGAHFFEIEFRIAGTYSLTATDTQAPNMTVTQMNIVIVAAEPVSFTVTGYPSPSTAGDMGSVTVTAGKDRYGNATTNYRGKIHFTSTDPMATLPADYTFTAADVNGNQTQHTFMGVSLCLVGTQTITVRDVNPKHHITGSQGGLVVNPGPPAELALMFLQSPVTAGVPVSIIVQAQDKCHNYTTNYLGTVHFTSSDPLVMAGNGLPNDYTFTAADMGRHTFMVEMRTAGNQTVTATDTGMGQISGTGAVVVNPGPANHFDVVPALPVTATVPFTVTVNARDRFNNLATGYVNVIRFSSSDVAMGVQLPPNYGFSQTDNGSHTFSMGVTLRTKGNQTLTVTDTANAAITGTVTINVNPAPTQVVVSTSGSTTYGQTATFRATVSAVSPASGVPTGMVKFRVDGMDAGNFNLDANGMASYMINTLGAGMHTITAMYLGDMTYATNTSNGLGQNVLPAPLTITADNKTKVYGDNLPAFTASYSGFVLGEGPGVLQGVLTFMTPANAGSPVGTYAITPGGQTAANYTITYVNGTLTVTPAPLTITADNKAKLYGAAVPTLTASYAGFVNGDTPASLTNPVVLNTSASMSSSVGTYPITASGASSPNYTITYVNGTLTVNPAPLTITADNKAKLYGAALPSFTVSYNGFVLGEGPSVLTGTLTFMTPATAPSPVGNYPITPGGQTATNYTITYANGTLTVNPAPLTITADNKTKVYGDPLPTLTATYSGFVLGEGPGVLQGVLTLTTAATAASPVGNYAITPGGQTATNYAITYVNGTLAVRPAPLTITADNKTKVYGDNLPAFTASYSGFVLGEGPGVLQGVLTFMTPANAGSPVGTYAITPGGQTAANYAISYVNGTLTVTPAPLTITADNKTKLYGAAVPTLTATYTGFVNGDTAASLTNPVALNTSASMSSSVGTYPITASGASSPNYTITFANGTLTVNPAPLTITADNKAKPYGAALPSFTASYNGFVLGEGPSVLTGTLTFMTTATAASPVGTYPITPGGQTSTNYAITYVNGTLTVTRVPLTISADNKTKVYGDPLPLLTATYTGFVNGDTPANLTTAVTLSTTATTNSPVGTYPITASGATSNNYTISFVNGTLTVTQAMSITGVSSSMNPSVVGQPVTFNVTVSSGAGVPTGSVTFYDGNNPISMQILDPFGHAAYMTAMLSPGTHVIQAVYGGDTNFGMSTGSVTQTVNAAMGNHFDLLAPATVMPNMPFSIAVTARNGMGQLNTGYRGTVHFTSSDGMAVLPPDYTFTAADNGSRSFSVTLKTLGSQTVTVTDTLDGSFTGTAHITVTQTPANHFGLIAPASIGPGTMVSIAVQALDQFNNPVPGYQGSVHFSSSDSLAQLPANYTFTAADNGVHTFGLVLNTQGSQSITVTDTVNNSVQGSANINVTGGDSIQILVATLVALNTPFPITFTALGPDGQTDSGYAGTIHVTSSDGQAVLPTDYTFTSADHGVHTLAVTLRTMGSQTITASDTHDNSVTGSVTVNVADLSGSLVLNGPPEVKPGSQFGVVLDVFDGNGQPFVNYPDTVHVASSDPLAALPADFTFSPGDQGAHGFMVILRSPGSQTITATDTADDSMRAVITVAVMSGVSPRVRGFGVAFQPSSSNPASTPVRGSPGLGSRQITGLDALDPATLVAAPSNSSPVIPGNQATTLVVPRSVSPVLPARTGEARWLGSTTEPVPLPAAARSASSLGEQDEWLWSEFRDMALGSSNSGFLADLDSQAWLNSGPSGLPYLLDLLQRDG
jgi:hypothetical protein